MSSDVEDAYSVFPMTPTSSVTHWDMPTTMQKPQFGNVLFAIGLVVSGLPPRTVEYWAIDRLNDGKLDIALAKMNQRHV
jgi:hypothetical protein